MQYLHHNPPEQVAEYVDQALTLATADTVPDDLRVAVFTEAVRLLAAKVGIQQQPLAARLSPSLKL